MAPGPAESLESCQQAGECGEISQAVGEPVTVAAGQVFPSWQERVLFVLTNRARADPAKQMAECTPGAYKACPWAENVSGACYSPVGPLVWDLAGSRAARFHATYLSKAPCGLGHNTCCNLRTDVASSFCDGDPACACVAGTQSCTCSTCGNPTGFGTRLSRFGFSGSGEIAHQYYTDPVTIFHGWIDEVLGTASTTCGSNGSNGHRWLILRNGGPRVGVGHFAQATSCNSPYWVQDFGGAATAIPRVPGGVHYPRSGTTSTSFTFWANYHHAGGAAPRSAQLVVNGQCQPLTLEFGAAASGTYRRVGTLPAGCQPYYFLFVDSAGARVTFPTTGSLTVAVGGSCGSEWVSNQLSASCESGSPDAGAADAGADAGAPDAGLPDAGAADAGADAGAPDAGRPDAGADAGAPDAGRPDAGADAGTPDAGRPDAGADAGAPDAGEVDAGPGSTDAGLPSSGPADAGDTAAHGSVTGGCGCATGGAPFALFALGLLGAAPRRRRAHPS